MKRKNTGMTILWLLFVVQLPLQVFADEISQKIQHNKSNPKVQFGGVAGTGFTLLGVEHKKIDRADRIILEIGNYKGEPHKGWPSYYHTELDPKTKKLIVDLAQTPNSMVSDETLKRLFAKVELIKSSMVVADPTEPNLTLIFELKKDVQMKAYQVQGKKTTSKIVIDLMSL